MNKWKDGWLVRGIMKRWSSFTIRTFCPKIPVWRGNEFPDPGGVQQEAELIGRNIEKLIQASKGKWDEI